MAKKKEVPTVEKKKEVKPEVVEAELLYSVKFKCNVVFNSKKKFVKGQEAKLTKTEMNLVKGSRITQKLSHDL